MIVLAIVATLAAIVWTAIVLLEPSMDFQYGWTVIAAWVFVAIMWLAWWIG